MRIMLDTNIIRAVIDPEHSQQVTKELQKLIDNNKCGVSYLTLFELVAKYRKDINMIKRIFIFLTQKNISIAANNDVNVEQFYQLAYSEKELSLLDLKAIANSLLEQASNGINNLLSEVFKLFSILYAYMKLNRTQDAYYRYIQYAVNINDNFSNFHPEAFKYFSSQFALSYSNSNTPKFETFIKSQFWEIVVVIESRYELLNGKPESYILDIDWETEFSKSHASFLKRHSNHAYQSIVKKAYKELKHGEKHICSLDDLISIIDFRHTLPLWQDFFSFYLRKLLTGEEVLKYNDIIDFINLKIAVQEKDCYLLTLDFKFLESRLSNFTSISNSAFCKKSLEAYFRIRKE